MNIQPLKKELVCGIIVLCVGITASPIIGSLPTRTGSTIDSLHVDPAIGDFNFSINGTMGYNGWYVSSVVIIIDSGMNLTFYKLHAGDPWTEYTGPITISTDGIYELIVYYVDPYGESIFFGPFPFKIDMTPPVLQLNETIGFRRWGFTITVYDNTSGVGAIGIYIDNLLVGNLTTPPFSFIWTGPVWRIIWKYFRTGDSSYLPSVVAYDKAGNSVSKHAKALCLP
jgi:hypothetical protein